LEFNLNLMFLNALLKFVKKVKWNILMLYPIHLINARGDILPRKNIYLLNLAQADNHDANRIRSRRDSHPYIKKHNAFKIAEKNFLQRLSEQKEKYNLSLQTSNKINKYRLDLFAAEKKYLFYREYVDLDYDAELEFEIANLQLKKIPKIISENESTINHRHAKELELEIHALKRVIPIEIEKIIPINSILGFLVPGLGQLLNKQYKRAIIFFVGTLFIYFVILPCIVGCFRVTNELIKTLLILTGIVIVFFSFRDSYKSEKNEMNGARIIDEF